MLLPIHADPNLSRMLLLIHVDVQQLFCLIKHIVKLSIYIP